MKIQDLIIVAVALGFLVWRRAAQSATVWRLAEDRPTDPSMKTDRSYDMEISESEVQDIYEEQGIPWSGGALTSTVPVGDYARSDYLA